MKKVTPDDVVKYAPEFATYAAANDEQVCTFIGLAKSFVNEGVWQSKYVPGVSLMTAHLMRELGIGSEAGMPGAATGAVTQQKVGDLSVSYGQFDYSRVSIGDQLLLTTPYGKQFLMLRKTLTITPMVT